MFALLLVMLFTRLAHVIFVKAYSYERSLLLVVVLLAASLSLWGCDKSRDGAGDIRGADECIDTPGWTNGEGHTCEMYEQNWCKFGIFWGVASLHNHPDENCCACGKDRCVEEPPTPSPTSRPTPGPTPPPPPTPCPTPTPTPPTSRRRRCHRRRSYRRGGMISENDSTTAASQFLAPLNHVNKAAGSSTSNDAWTHETANETDLEPSR